MTRRRKTDGRGPAAILLVLALFAAALPAAAKGRGSELGYVTDLVHKLYLEPLGVSNALLKVETEHFASGQRPMSFTVRAGQRGDGHDEFEELLEVGVIVVDGKLMFISATGPLIERTKALPAEARQERVKAATRYLESISAWRATDARRPGRKKNTEEIDFDDPTEFPWPAKGPRTVVFDTKSGLLLIAGAPMLPAAESR